MSIYATPQNVVDAWSKIHTSGLVNDELRTMIERASNLVDSKLARTYTVPFCTDPADAPPRIRDLVVDICMTDVFDRSPNTPEWIVRRINRAYEALEKLAAGDDGLVGEDGGVIPELTTIDVPSSNTSAYTPVFGAHPSLAERVDPSRVSAEASARGATSSDEEV